MVKKYKVELVVVGLAFLIGLFFGFNLKQCKDCTIENIELKENEKKILDSTDPDSAWVEWQRRNGTSK